MREPYNLGVIPWIPYSYTAVQAYEEYFKALDQSGGFFYERWGDAPVHSLGAVMLLNSTEVCAHCPAYCSISCSS